MRALTAIWLAISSAPLLAAAADPCTSTPRAPGTPIDAPHAVFEAYVVEVYAPEEKRSEFGVERSRRALVEVVRSYHGPYSPGQEVETVSFDGAKSCARSVESGAHVIVGSVSGGPFEIIETLARGEAVAPGPFAALALAGEKQRESARPALKNATLRGEIDDSVASQLRARARTGKNQRCEIASAGKFAQVSWGKAFGGNDARHKVIFERVDREWVEILRFDAPTPTPARSKSRRGKQRALWAQESIKRPAVASADSTS